MCQKHSPGVHIHEQCHTCTTPLHIACVELSWGHQHAISVSSAVAAQVPDNWRLLSEGSAAKAALERPVARMGPLVPYHVSCPDGTVCAELTHVQPVTFLYCWARRRWKIYTKREKGKIGIVCISVSLQHTRNSPVPCKSNSKVKVNIQWFRHCYEENITMHTAVQVQISKPIMCLQH